MGMYETAQQLANKAREITERKNRNLYGGTNHSVIVAVNPETDYLELQMRDKPIRAKHPHLSLNSWIRATIEQGTTCTFQYSQDLHTPELANLVDLKIEDRITTYKREQGLYRPLQHGEIEIKSIGDAVSYWGKRTAFESKAGVVRTWQDSDELENGAKAPIHRFVLHRNVTDSYGDELRFGIVKRKTSPIFSKYPKRADGKYARELSVNLLDQNSKPLLDKKEGHVFDEKGNEVSEKGVPLRLYHKFYTATGKTVEFKIDEKGNFVFKLPQDSDRGGEIVIPSGSLTMDLGQLLRIVVGNEAVIRTKKGDLSLLASGGGDAVLDGDKRIYIGSGSTEPAVLGTKFLTAMTAWVTALATHVHPGVPPSPTIAPAATNLLNALAQALSTTVTIKN